MWYAFWFVFYAFYMAALGANELTAVCAALVGAGLTVQMFKPPYPKGGLK